MPVRYCEGSVHGFLTLRHGDSIIADGDLLQTPGDSTLESRMVFALHSYHLVQRGPAFDADLDARPEADGHDVVTSTSHDDGKQQSWDGHLDLPADTYNGLPVILAKNLRSGDTVTVHLVAFTPKPRLIELVMASEGEAKASRGRRSETLARYRLSPSPVVKLLAQLLGKLPADSHLWIASTSVPAFLRFEGPLYQGPVWPIDLTTPTSDDQPAP